VLAKQKLEVPLRNRHRRLGKVNYFSGLKPRDPGPRKFTTPQNLLNLFR
jgi:hypothetical protein